MHLVCVVYVHVCVYLYVCVPASYSGEYTGSSLCTVDKLYTCKQSTHVHTLTVHVESLHHRQALHLQAEYNHKQCTHMHVVHVCVPVSYRGADTRGRVFCTSATSRSNRAWTHVYICVCMCACICMHIHHTCVCVYCCAHHAFAAPRFMALRRASSSDSALSAICMSIAWRGHSF